MANSLSITNFINVSVATPQQGVGTPNTGNVAIFSRDAYASTFGTAGYKIYLSPGQVGIDFGTSSNTYLMAVSLFSNQPNILNANGYLVVIPFLNSAQDQQVSVTFPGTPASGHWYLEYNGALTSALAYNETAANLQTALRSVSGLSSATASGSVAAGFAVNSAVSGVGHPFTALGEYTFTVTSANATVDATYTDSAGTVFTVAATIASQTTLVCAGNTAPVASGTLTKASGTGDSTITYSAATYTGLEDSLSNTITPVVTVVVPGAAAETLDQAIIRTQSLVSYFGVMATEIASLIVTQAAAAYIQTQNMIGFFASITSSDLQSGGLLYNLTALGYTQSRELYYGGTTVQALGYMASYAGLLLSVNYNGVNTCLTMNLKNLTSVAADPTLTQTQWNLAQTCGADVYANYSSFGNSVLPKCTSFGANDYSDNQSNIQAFVLYVTAAYFNTLAQTNTKIPQTEAGMNLVKANLRAVCRQFVTNGFIAPGTWTSSTTFGNQQLFLQNIAQAGFYVYSPPVSQQNPTQRAARQNVPISIAIKYSGAQQGGTAVIYVNP